METPTLQQVIRDHIQLPVRANSRGFYPVLCKVCGDHGKKGKRAGFKFDGTSVGYNCFNCGHGAAYDSALHKSMPRDMITVLEAFGVEKPEWSSVLLGSLMSQQDGSASTEHSQRQAIEPESQTPPDFFYQLTDDPNDEWAQYAIEYLTSRHVDWKSHPFFVVRKSDHPDNPRWYGRLIIPSYKGGRLIFWQGRDMTDLHVKKYLSLNVARDNILGGFDRLFENTTEPLYVTEGWFDSYHVNGVAVYGSKLTQNQITWLNRCPRQKIVIPDRYGDGHLLARQAISLGWSVSYPEIGDCKDVSDAVAKYGKLYTLMSIQQNTHNGFAAEALLPIYCKETP